MTKGIWKDVPHHMSSGKCILKQWDATTHLLEWSKSGHCQHQMLEKRLSNRSSLSLLMGMQNDTATLESSLAVSYKTKHTLVIHSSNYAPWCLSKGVENLCPHKTLHTDVYYSFIHNCQNLKTTKMSFSRWTDKQWYIHTKGILFIH